MRRFFVPAFAIILAGCQNSGSPDNADISLVIGEQLVLVTTSYVGDRVEWIVIREYAPDDTDAAKRDKRVRFEQGDALVELPDGTTRSLKDSNILFYLNDEGVEAHAVHLVREDLDVLYTEAHETTAALIEMLEEISRGHGYN
ncbi:MAG: hypothetical protein IH969_05420 [Candidatus Krumholzibacteriota bacterium]|nr:hypothetical protein [Candidatus Krumholzibacteriota bacterium]